MEKTRKLVIFFKFIVNRLEQRSRISIFIYMGGELYAFEVFIVSIDESDTSYI